MSCLPAFTGKQEQNITGGQHRDVCSYRRHHFKPAFTARLADVEAHGVRNQSSWA
jgi:hypothetical protein